jgi:hypothetical protein
MAPTRNAEPTMSIPWAMQMQAISVEEPSRLQRFHPSPRPRRAPCVDIYSVMIASGVELIQRGHIRFTELCQCTRSHQKECGAEIASIDLEIQTFPVEITHRARAAEVV